jgi:LysR family transcriptional regulator, low CO2-responsive transcriptional regulator
MTSDRETLVEIESSFDSGLGLSDESLHGARSIKLWAAKRMAMTLNQFSSFAAVAKHLSMTKASAELRVSQPSLSLQLKQLESQHGAKLYRRLSKGIEVTEAGQLFLRTIMPILEQVAKLEGGFKPPKAKATRELLRAGGTFSACAILLPALLARLQQRYPRAEFECRTKTSDQLERLVINSAMDVAVIARPVASRELVSEPLRAERVVMFVPGDHPLALKKNLKLRDLFTETFIIRGGTGISGTTEKALRQFRKQGLDVKIGLRCDDPMAIKAAVRQGMGVGMGFEDTVKGEVDGGEFKILDLDGLKLAGQSFIIYSKKRPLSKVAQEFLELLRGARTV